MLHRKCLDECDLRVLRSSICRSPHALASQSICRTAQVGHLWCCIVVAGHWLGGWSVLHDEPERGQAVCGSTLVDRGTVFQCPIRGCVVGVRLFGGESVADTAKEVILV